MGRMLCRECYCLPGRITQPQLRQAVEVFRESGWPDIDTVEHAGRAYDAAVGLFDMWAEDDPQGAARRVADTA